MGIVYVSCSAPARIYVFDLDTATGKLTQKDEVPIPCMDGEENGPATPLAFSPDRSKLYAHIRMPPFPVATFAVDKSSGALRVLGVTSVPDQCSSIRTDQTGRHLLMSSYQGAKIASQPIGPDGVVQEPATQVLPTPIGAHSIMPDPTNRFVYVGNIASSSVLRFGFDAATGRLDPLEPVKAKPHAEPRHVRFSPNGRFLFVINEGDATINAYACDSTNGALREIQSISIMPDGAQVEGSRFAAEIQITPDGRFLYGSVRATNTLMVLRVDPATGAMSRVASVPCEKWPRNFAIDPAGRWLLCGGQEEDTLGIYAIDQGDGGLTRVGVQEARGKPNWIEFLS